MKKASLRDIKKQNRQLILQCVLDEPELSRIDISQKTGLSPSTVTALVSELLDEGMLVETGALASTGGRRRITLSVNPRYGMIAIVEIGRTGAGLHIFDMLLEKTEDRVLSERYITGNTLLIEITAALFDHFKAEGLHSGRLAGIGLLFQEDMHERDFSVMYSTSLSADNISLREALYTQFKIPVVEEYTQAYSITEAVSEVPQALAVKNSAHISIASSVLASISIEGQPLPMRDGKSANLTGFVEGYPAMLPAAEMGGTLAPAGPPAERLPLATRVAGLIAMLCSLFSLDVVFLSGKKAKKQGFVPAVGSALAGMLAPEAPPRLQAIELTDDEVADRLAARIRHMVLCAG